MQCAERHSVHGLYSARLLHIPPRGTAPTTLRRLTWIALAIAAATVVADIEGRSSSTRCTTCVYVCMCVSVRACVVANMEVPAAMQQASRPAAVPTHVLPCGMPHAVCGMCKGAVLCKGRAVLWLPTGRRAPKAHLLNGAARFQPGKDGLVELHPLGVRAGLLEPAGLRARARPGRLAWGSSGGPALVRARAYWALVLARARAHGHAGLRVHVAGAAPFLVGHVRLGVAPGRVAGTALPGQCTGAHTRTLLPKGPKRVCTSCPQGLYMHLP